MLDDKDIKLIQKMIKDEGESIVVQLSKILIRMEGRIDKIEDRLDKIEKRLDQIEKRLDILEFEVRDIKRRLKGLENDTPTASEMRRLDARVTKLEKTVGIN